VKDPKQRAIFSATKNNIFWKGLNLDNVLTKVYTPKFVPQKTDSIEEDCERYF
jgi:hypothetical protein